MTSRNTSGNIRPIDPVKQRQIENREKMKKWLDNRGVPGYNDDVSNEFLSVLGEEKMAGRTAQVPASEFLPKYLAAVKAGKTNEEFAASMGIDPKKCSIRASGLRSQLAKKGKVLPHLQNRRAVNSDLDSLIQSLDDIAPEVADTDSAK